MRRIVFNFLACLALWLAMLCALFRLGAGSGPDNLFTLNDVRRSQPDNWILRRCKIDMDSGGRIGMAWQSSLYNDWDFPVRWEALAQTTEVESTVFHRTGSFSSPGVALQAPASGFLAKYQGASLRKPGEILEWVVITPLWVIVAVLSSPIALKLIGGIRKWRLGNQGHCKSCGYDLRASSDRCPECGALVNPPRSRRFDRRIVNLGASVVAFGAIVFGFQALTGRVESMEKARWQPFQATADLIGDAGYYTARVRDDLFRGANPDGWPFAWSSNAKSSHSSPLWTAIELNRLENARIIVESGANVNLRQDRDDGMTPLQMACWKKDVSLVELLLAHGADPNATVSASGETELYFLLEYHPWNQDIIDLLLKYHADPNLDPYQCSCLARAIAANDGHVVKELLAAGADVNAADHWGFTPLHMLSRVIDPRFAQTTYWPPKQELIDAVLAYHPKLNPRNQEGYTPLHLALMKGNFAVAMALINAGADVMLQDNYHHFPLDMFNHIDCPELAELLKAKGSPGASAPGY